MSECKHSDAGLCDDCMDRQELARLRRERDEWQNFAKDVLGDFADYHTPQECRARLGPHMTESERKFAEAVEAERKATTAQWLATRAELEQARREKDLAEQIRDVAISAGEGLVAERDEARRERDDLRWVAADAERKAEFRLEACKRVAAERDASDRRYVQALEATAALTAARDAALRERDEARATNRSDAKALEGCYSVQRRLTAERDSARAENRGLREAAHKVANLVGQNPFGVTRDVYDAVADLAALAHAALTEGREGGSAEDRSGHCGKCNGPCRPQNHAGWNPNEDGHG